MVAVRSAHLNKAGEFDPQKWIASLGISSQQSCERLTETWAYCLRTTQGILTPICCCGAAWRWWKSSPC
jgi:GTP pyrophosphokinase